MFERAQSRVSPNVSLPGGITWIDRTECDRTESVATSGAARAFDLTGVRIFRQPGDSRQQQTLGDERRLSAGATTAVAQARASSGRRFPDAVRERLERGTGADFSGVRIHAGASSGRAANELGARAFTVGKHIHFAAGAYDPTSERGFTLIAHEAVHTLQQGDAGGSGGLELSAPQDAQEIEAERAAHALADGRLPAARARTIAPPQRIHRAPDPLALEANRVKDELQRVIAGATWKEIRKRVYPQQSAAGIARAQLRHGGNIADLTGLGKLSSLDHFAQSVRAVQAQWSTINPDDRVKKLGKAADAELVAADVPGFLALDKQPMEFKAFFSPGTWGFTISEALVNANSLPNDDAAELANTTLHESRHAEQQFLSARYSAGVNNKDAAGIVTEQQIPQAIADKAVARKFNATTDAKVAALGQQMYAATVTDAAKNQQISNDDGISELNAKRATAQTALTTLNMSVTPQTISDAKAATDALKAQILVVEQKYPLYRNIPYEADAHEVGDAAELAFKGWPTPRTTQLAGHRVPKNPVTEP